MDMSRSLILVLKFSWLIVLVGVVAGGLAYFASGTLPRAYESESRVLVGSLTEADLQRQLGYQELARVYASLASSPIVLDEVSTTIGSDEPVNEIADRVSAQALADEAIVSIITTAASPDDAAALANAISDRIVSLARPTPTSPSLVQVIAPALADDTAVSPRIMFNTAIAAFLGLALGTLLVFLIGSRRETPATTPESSSPPGQPAYPPGPYSR